MKCLPACQPLATLLLLPLCFEVSHITNHSPGCARRAHNDSRAPDAPLLALHSKGLVR